MRAVGLQTSEIADFGNQGSVVVGNGMLLRVIGVKFKEDNVI
jgi:hypothetical protein